MSNVDFITITDRFIAAITVGDWHQLAVSLDPNIHYTEIVTGHRMHGIGSCIQTYRDWKRAFPDGSGTIRKTVMEGTLVVQEVLWEGTQMESIMLPHGTLPASGHHVSFTTTLWYTCYHDRITAISHAPDLYTLLRQLGAVRYVDPTLVGERTAPITGLEP